MFEANAAQRQVRQLILPEILLNVQLLQHRPLDSPRQIQLPSQHRHRPLPSNPPFLR